MARLAAVPGSRPRRPRAAVAEQACEVQAALRAIGTADLWGAAFRTGDPAIVEACKTLDHMLKATAAVAWRIAGLAEPEPPAEAVAA